MNRTKVFLALVGYVLTCPHALAQETPQRPQSLPDRPRVTTQGSQALAPLPDGVPTISLQVFLEGIAADLDMDFLIDSRARQNIYVGGTRTENVSYPILLSILRNNQLVAVEIEGRVNVIPEALARQLPVPLVQRGDPDVPDDQVVSRVIQMNNMNAAQAVPLLRALLPQYAHLAALPDQNKLIIVDRYANVKRLTEMLDALDD